MTRRASHELKPIEIVRARRPHGIDETHTCTGAPLSWPAKRRVKSTTLLQPRGHQQLPESQILGAASPSGGDQATLENQTRHVAAEAGRARRELKSSKTVLAIAQLETMIAHKSRMLWDIQKTRIQVSNRVQQLQRDGVAPLFMAGEKMHVDGLQKLEHKIDSELQALMKQHPLAPFIERIDGLGYGGVGRLLGVIGSFERFPNVAKLWKYLGYHVEKGHAPRRQRGVKGGYVPQGRMIGYQIGDGLIKQNENSYRRLYDEEKAKYLARPRLGPSGCPFSHEPHVRHEREHHAETGWQVRTGKEQLVQCIKLVDGKESSQHVHNAALRYMVKRLLADLWGEWQRVRPGHS